MIRNTLAKAAAQQLKGVIVEYDVLCSTIIGRSVAEQAEEQRRVEAKRERDDMTLSTGTSGGMFSKLVSNMFVRDVRTTLRDLQIDSTGNTKNMKERLASTLQGLPTHIMERVTGNPEKEALATGKSEEEVYLEQQLASASAEMEHIKAQKAAEKEQRMRTKQSSSSETSTIRDKYMDKLNKLKAKTKGQDPKEALKALYASQHDASQVTPAKGLTTWLVHPGARELLSYAAVRGIAMAITPPASPSQYEEFELFCNEMESTVDLFMPTSDYLLLPDPTPIKTLCSHLELKPLDVLVIAKHAPTITAARSAGAYSCHYMMTEDVIPNHDATYQLSDLKEFQFIVEEFNGISYRGRIA